MSVHDTTGVILEYEDQQYTAEELRQALRRLARMEVELPQERKRADLAEKDLAEARENLKACDREWESLKREISYLRGRNDAVLDVLRIQNGKVIKPQEE